MENMDFTFSVADASKRKERAELYTLIAAFAAYFAVYLLHILYKDSGEGWAWGIAMLAAFFSPFAMDMFGLVEKSRDAKNAVEAAHFVVDGLRLFLPLGFCQTFSLREHSFIGEYIAGSGGCPECRLYITDAKGKETCFYLGGDPVVVQKILERLHLQGAVVALKGQWPDHC